jgi:hypothetical protein
MVSVVLFGSNLGFSAAFSSISKKAGSQIRTIIHLRLRLNSNPVAMVIYDARHRGHTQSTTLKEA